MDASRYARYGGFRREEGMPYYAQFGYGGADYGGFGRYGKYGGWRSSYDYRTPMKYVYDDIDHYPVNMIYPTSHMPTFILAVVVIVVMLLGIWYGRNNNSYSYSYSY